jgi:hypothetical protein
MLLGSAASGGSVSGSAPAETVVFLAPTVREIRDGAHPVRTLRLDVRGGFVVPRVSCAPMHSPVVLVSSDSVFADVAAYIGVSDLLFRRKFVIAGDRYQGSLDRPGIVTLESEVKPLVRAWIYVTPTAIGAVTGPEGRFVLERVPAGKRRFTAWHPEKGIVDREIDVPETGAAALDVVFPAKSP